MFPFKNLNYHQKALAAILCFVLSLSFSFVFMILSLQDDIDQVNHEIKGLPYVREIIKIVDQLCRHKIMLDRYLQNNRQLKEEIVKIQQQIDNSFKNLIAIDEKNEEELKTLPNQLKELRLNSLKPIDLERSWNTLSSKTFELTLNTSKQLHSELIDSMIFLLNYLAKSSEFILERSIDRYYLSTTSITLLPKQINILSLLIPAIFQAFKNKEISAEKMSEITVLKGILLTRNQEINYQMQETFLYNRHLPQSERINPKIKEFLEDYLRASQIFVNLIELYPSQNLPKEDTQFIMTQGLGVLDAAIFLDQEILNEIGNLLEVNLTNLRIKELFGISVSLGTMLLGLFLGTYLLSTIDRSLKTLKEASGKLAVGDLSARVPSLGSDDIGKIGEDFNKIACSFEELLRWLQWTGIQLTTSTTEISAAAKEQENTITYQEATTKQIAITAGQISNTAKNFAKTMSEVSTMAEETSSLAASGKEGLAKMEGVITLMADASGNIAAKLATLNEKTSAITSIISTIAKVADQTNLLSLNAAIEAEKAGEHGRSFSVIAREIRRLADQIANSTIDIEKMINEMVTAVSAGVMGVDKFSKEIQLGVTQLGSSRDLMSKIMSQVQQLTNGLESVNQGTQAQSLGAEQITNSINMLSETTQATTQSIRQFHKAIEELSHAAKELQATVSKVKN